MVAMRLVFLGTPEFAVPALREAVRHDEVLLAVAQPDRPRGRGRHLTAPPLKEAALHLGLTCMQVETPNRPGAIAALQALAPDLFVVVAYGAILSPELLAVPRLGAINLHGSLLPAYRGASPIQAAIADGLGQTGVSTMWMDAGLDTGDVIFEQAVPVGPDQTSGELSDVLAATGAALLARTLRAIERGDAPRTPQDGARATLTKRLKKRDGFVDFTQPARRVHDRARAMTPWPGALATFNGESVRFVRTRVSGVAIEDTGGGPGAIRGATPAGGLLVGCGEGAIEVLRLTPAGRPEMDAAAWWRGLRQKDDAPARFATPREEDAW
jgi:methionyl-tRNA formyltransferase